MRTAFSITRFAASRAGYALLALGCASLLGFGYYLQFQQGLEPCPLCIFQRIAFFAVGAVALIALLHGPRGTTPRVYAVLLALRLAYCVCRRLYCRAGRRSDLVGERPDNRNVLTNSAALARY